MTKKATVQHVPSPTGLAWAHANRAWWNSKSEVAVSARAYANELYSYRLTTYPSAFNKDDPAAFDAIGDCVSKRFPELAVQRCPR